MRNAKEYSWYRAKETKAGSACCHSYPAPPISCPGTHATYSFRAIYGSELCTIFRINGPLVLNASYINEYRSIRRNSGPRVLDASYADECGAICGAYDPLSTASTRYAATDGAAAASS